VLEGVAQVGCEGLRNPLRINGEYRSAHSGVPVAGTKVVARSVRGNVESGDEDLRK